jgi:hypothetical protein
LDSVYGSMNVPHTLVRGAIAPPAWHAQVADRPEFDALPSLHKAAAIEAPAARADRVAGLVLHHLFSQSLGLPAFAHAQTAAPEYDLESSFADFTDRLVAGALQRVYRPSELPALLAEVGEDRVDKELVAGVRQRLACYEHATEAVRRSKPLIRQIRRAPRNVCYHGIMLDRMHQSASLSLAACPISLPCRVVQLCTGHVILIQRRHAGAPALCPRLTRRWQAARTSSAAICMTRQARQAAARRVL